MIISVTTYAITIINNAIIGVEIAGLIGNSVFPVGSNFSNMKAWNIYIPRVALLIRAILRSIFFEK
jgi:hypothetical protein